MLGGAVIAGLISVNIVIGTAMATGDDDATTCFLLQVIEDFNEDRIDVFFAMDEREPMLCTSLAIGDGQGLFRVDGIDEWRV